MNGYHMQYYDHYNRYGRNFDSFKMSGEQYCESEHMKRNEDACRSSSCCHWNTEEQGDASFNGKGRCWSRIGQDMCFDMDEDYYQFNHYGNNFESQVGNRKGNTNNGDRRQDSERRGDQDMSNADSHNEGRNRVTDYKMQQEAIGSMMKANHFIVTFAVIGSLSLIYCAANLAYQKFFDSAGYQTIQEEI